MKDAFGLWDAQGWRKLFGTYTTKMSQSGKMSHPTVPTETNHYLGSVALHSMLKC